MRYHFAFVYLVIASLFSCKQGSNSVYPVKKDLTQAVYASGKLYPLNNYKVFTRLPGYVEKILVHVGDSVKPQTPLLTIKSEVSRINVEAAENQLALAQKNADESGALLTALRQDVGAAKAKYELDSSTWYRYNNLLKENATARQQADQAKAQFEISKQTFLKAFNNLLNTRERLRTELQNAQLQLEAQRSNSGDYTLMSVVSGKVYDIIPKEGELANTQLPVMELGSAAQFEVELSVDETDVALIKTGQEIAFAIDAFGDKVFKGKVKEIYPRISQGNKTSKVIADIELGNEKALYSGMSVEANIIIAQKQNVLVIPREFLMDGKRKVKTKAGDEVEILKGAEDLQFVEVLGGIDENTELVK